ncbi:MAG: hypothetical protein JWN46_2514 [Acidimicrobiales bacterium]|nr:hypothetical protein [Acidimicrobiales bacterium]
MAGARRAGGVTAGVVAVALLVAGGCSSSKKDSSASSTTVAGGATTSAPHGGTTSTKQPAITIQAGINSRSRPNVVVLQYMPAQATVSVGQTVRWTWSGAIEPHSVTFFPPGQQAPTPDKALALFKPTPAKRALDGTTFVNSGVRPLGLVKPGNFEVKFAKPGTYKYVCVLHPQMVGTINVVTGSGGETAAAVSKRGKDEQKFWTVEGEGVGRFLRSVRVKPVTHGKHRTWTILMGATGAHTEYLGFAPASQGVRAGDTVTFVNTSTEPHTATFFGSTPPNLDPTDPRGRTAAPGPLTLDGVFSTGVLPPDTPPGSTPESARSYSFVVPAAGKYTYVDVLHVLSRMVGVITAK